MDDMEQRIAELWAPNFQRWLDQGEADSALVNRHLEQQAGTERETEMRRRWEAMPVFIKIDIPEPCWWCRLWASLTGGN